MNRTEHPAQRQICWGVSHLLGSSAAGWQFIVLSVGIFLWINLDALKIFIPSHLSLSFSKWSQITSIFTFRKVLIVPRCKQGRYETVLISYFLRYDLCSNFFLYTFELTLWQKNSYNWIHTYLFVKSFFVGVSILYIHYNNPSWYFLKCIGIKLINWVQYFKHTNIWIISRFLLFFKNFSICEGGWFDSFDIFCCNCMGLCIFLVFFLQIWWKLFILTEFQLWMSC